MVQRFPPRRIWEEDFRHRTLSLKFCPDAEHVEQALTAQRVVNDASPDEACHMMSCSENDWSHTWLTSFSSRWAVSPLFDTGCWLCRNVASCDHSSVVLSVEMNTTYACFNCVLALANESVSSISTFDGKSIFCWLFSQWVYSVWCVFTLFLWQNSN